MVRAVVCDLDGTVYLGGTPIPGSPEAIARLREGGVRVLFVSNNPTRTASDYADRLSGMSIPTRPDDVLTSGGVTARWLAAEHPDARVYVIGEQSLVGELLAAGVRLASDDDAPDADIVLAAFDRTFTYTKWERAHQALLRGALFVATNPDAACPVDGGGTIPDCAGVTAGLTATTGRALDVVVGKPSAIMAAAILGVTGTRASETLAVGDRVATDVELATANGFAGALVLSGVTTAEQAAALPDDVAVLGSLADLPAHLGLAQAAV
ncbi:HAD-superfamily hydrolase, subfamily IIA [Beutenbergia cavernae DSM 12333]|uniref:HAD-superfamily hydrolase, subfamily IIA n=2 Tax=Beutenbergia TaxID=84756 RepID=C5BYX9_BEUC1|nr:HAD-superfamily hydrolase, subfamily IIA [Beutenbergia cavernae DSM 12333]